MTDILCNIYSRTVIHIECDHPLQSFDDNYKLLCSKCDSMYREDDIDIYDDSTTFEL